MVIDLFGMSCRMKEITVDRLPLYLTAGRQYHQITYNGIPFILISLADDERFGVVALDKQAKIVAEELGMPVGFRFESVSRSQRDSLVKRGVAFVAGEEQIFLPFLGVAMSNRFRAKKIVDAQKMMPATQALFLYLLYVCRGEPVMKKQAAEAIGVTRASVTRASEQLEAMGLITQEMRGKECYMRTELTGMSLYEAARPHMINPVQKIITIENKRRYKDLPLAGESALAECTMLNAPAVVSRSVDKSGVNVDELQEIDMRWETDKEVICLELWKYDPTLFMVDGIADPISLVLSLEGNEDERVEEAIDEYMEAMDGKWD